MGPRAEAESESLRSRMKIDPRDEKFVLKDIPIGFSPERNQAIIDDTIRKTDENIKRKWALWEDKTRERANALASYFRYLEHGKGGSNPLNKYFSRKMRAYLRGEEIISTLKDAYQARNANGQIITYHGSS